MKKSFALFLSLLLLLSLVIPASAEGESTETTAAASTAPSETVSLAPSASCKGLDAQATMAGSVGFSLYGRTAFLYDPISDTLVYANNPDLRMIPGGLVKIMVCMLAAERLDPNAFVTVTAAMLEAVPLDAYVSGFQAGCRYTVEQLMHSVMMDAGNDATAILAIMMSGTTSAFVDEMNARAEALGCTGTHYGNIYGFQDDDTYTTARDLAKIVVAASKLPSFWACYTCLDYDVPEEEGSPAMSFYAGSYLRYQSTLYMYYDASVQGAKNAQLAIDRFNSVNTVMRDGMQFVVIVGDAGVTLNEETGGIMKYGHLEDAVTIYEYAYKNFQFATVAYAGQGIVQYPVNGGANDVVLGVTDTVAAVLPKQVKLTDIRQEITVDSKDLTAPMEQGQMVGNVEFWYGSNNIGSSRLVTLSQVKKAPADNPLNVVPEVIPEKQEKSLISTVLEVFGILFLVLLLLTAVLALRRRNLRRKMQARARRRRANAGRPQ